MNYAITTLDQIIIMLVIILIAMLLYKIKILDVHSNKVLSDLLLLVINPLVLFNSFQMEMNPKLVRGLFYSLLLAFISITLSILISLFLIPKSEKGNYLIERFACVYSNCGFFGIPLVSALFGNEGVFYLTAYMTVFNIFVWTHGIMMMTQKKSLGYMLKAFLSPATICIFLGLICFFARIHLPNIVMAPLISLASMNTPLAMVVAGVSLAQTDMSTILKKPRIYWVSVIKLLFVPIISILVFRFFYLPDIIVVTSVVEAACPTAAITIMFAIRYEKDYKYASELFAVSTVFSIVTIPTVIYLTQILCR